MTVYNPIIDFSIKIAGCSHGNLEQAHQTSCLQGWHKYRKPCAQLTNALDLPFLMANPENKCTNKCIRSSICLCVHQWQSYKVENSSNWGPSLHSPMEDITVTISHVTKLLCNLKSHKKLQNNMSQRCTSWLI